jgi:hypothetical protein
MRVKCTESIAKHDVRQQTIMSNTRGWQTRGEFKVVKIKEEIKAMQ